MALRILLVDDHAMFREGARSLLQAKGIEVIGEAPNGAEGIELVHQLHPDVVVMDLAMPVMGGLEATRLLKAEQPELPIVVLTASEEDEDLFEAVKAGAQGYLLKNLDGDTFVNMIQGAARGEPALMPPLAAKILAEFARIGQIPNTPKETRALATHDEAGPVEELTIREREVLELVVAGLSNRQIATRLVLSENTIKYHLKNILDKLHLQNRAQVVAFALRHGLTFGS